MMLPRRFVLAAPVLLLPPAFRLESSGNGRVALRHDGMEGAVTLPAERARVAAVLPIAGSRLAAVAFGADAGRDVLAVVGVEDGGLRVVGLEAWAWRGPGGAMLATRVSATGDGTRVRLERTAALPRPGLPKSWENWADLLSWRDHAPLADTPAHAPVGGTWQARLAELRARSIAVLADRPGTIDAAVLERVGLTGRIWPEGQ